MPTATPTEKRNPIPAGENILTLVSVTETQQPSYSNPQEMATRWVWQFKAQAKDPETGERFEYREYTGPNYGNVKAKLTQLLDMMMPGMDDEEKSSLDTDTLIGRSFKAKIRHEKGDKTGDPPKPRLAFIEPYKKPKAAPKPAAEEEEIGDGPDPFSDE